MEKQLLLFNGGLNTALSPHLVQENQAVECSNIDLTKGSIYPMKDTILIEEFNISGYSNIFFNKNLISSNIDELRSYATFGSNMYFTNGDYGAYGLYRIDKTTYLPVDAQPPTGVFGTISTSASTVGPLTGSYSYAYTVVDDEGLESAPSLVSTAVIASDNNILFAIDDTLESFTETIVARRVYRIGGANPTFNLVKELDVGTLSYIDDVSDINVSRIELTSFTNTPPPSKLINLVEANGNLWGSVDDRVYFSNTGKPEFWGELNFVNLDAKCTGLGVFRDTVIAFTEDNTYIINGFNVDNITLDRLPYKEGCLNNGSIAYITELLVWTSKNGVCAYNGESVTVVTRGLLEWQESGRVGSFTFDDFNDSEATFDSNLGYVVTSAVGVDNKYYAVYQNGLGVIDLTTGLIAYTIDLEDLQDVFYYPEENKIAIVSKALDLQILSTSDDNMIGRWKTGLISNGDYSIIKQYRKIEFDNVVSSVDVYIDDKLYISKENRSSFYLPSNAKGRSIQLDIQTDVEVRSVNIGYGVLK